MGSGGGVSTFGIPLPVDATASLEPRVERTRGRRVGLFCCDAELLRLASATELRRESDPIGPASKDGSGAALATDRHLPPHFTPQPRIASIDRDAETQAVGSRIPGKSFTSAQTSAHERTGARSVGRPSGQPAQSKTAHAHAHVAQAMLTSSPASDGIGIGCCGAASLPGDGGCGVGSGWQASTKAATMTAWRIMPPPR